jgi:hypothetical protein
MKTIENNKLIAEFMGIEILNFPYPTSKKVVYKSIKSNKISYPSIRGLKYHSSWDWLMPVVEKIEKLVFPNDEFFNINIVGGCQVYIISSHINEIIDSSQGETKLECLYNVVVQFIEWYNQNKLNEKQQ